MSKVGQLDRVIANLCTALRVSVRVHKRYNPAGPRSADVLFWRCATRVLPWVTMLSPQLHMSRATPDPAAVLPRVSSASAVQDAEQPAWEVPRSRGRSCEASCMHQVSTEQAFPSGAAQWHQSSPTAMRNCALSGVSGCGVGACGCGFAHPPETTARCAAVNYKGVIRESIITVLLWAIPMLSHHARSHQCVCLALQNRVHERKAMMCGCQRRALSLPYICFWGMQCVCTGANGMQLMGIQDLAANVAGCFVMGLIAFLQEQAPSDAAAIREHADNGNVALQQASIGIKTGFCGCLTTFSGWCAWPYAGCVDDQLMSLHFALSAL